MLPFENEKIINFCNILFLLLSCGTGRYFTFKQNLIVCSCTNVSSRVYAGHRPWKTPRDWLQQVAQDTECLGTLSPEVKEARTILSKHLKVGGPDDNKCIVKVVLMHWCHLARLEGEVPHPLVCVFMHEVGTNKAIHLTLGTHIWMTGCSWTGGQAWCSPRVLTGGDTVHQTQRAGGLTGRGPEQFVRVITVRRGSFNHGQGY